MALTPPWAARGPVPWDLVAVPWAPQAAARLPHHRSFPFSPSVPCPLVRVGTNLPEGWSLNCHGIAGRYSTPDPLGTLTSPAVPPPTRRRLAWKLETEATQHRISGGGKLFRYAERAEARGVRVPWVFALGRTCSPLPRASAGGGGGSKPALGTGSTRHSPATRTPGAGQRSASPGTWKQLSPCALTLYRRGQRLGPRDSPNGPWGQGWAFGVPWNQLPIAPWVSPSRVGCPARAQGIVGEVQGP